MSGCLGSWVFPLTVDRSFTLVAELSTILKLPVLRNHSSNPTLPRSVTEVQLFVHPPITSLDEICNIVTGNICTAVALFDEHGECPVLRAIIDRITSVLTAYLISQNDEYLSVDELFSAFQKEQDISVSIQKENLESILMTHLPQLASAKVRLNVLLEMQQLMEAMSSLTAASITFLRGLVSHMTNTLDSDELSLNTHALKEIEQTHDKLGHVIDCYRESGLFYTMCGIEKICESRASLEFLSSQILLGKSIDTKEELDSNKLT